MAGVEWEGESPPQASADDSLALAVWNFCATGMGGIDWSALPLAVEFFGATEIENLMHRLLVIKTHKPAKER